jgi:hypothetical protein
MKNEKKIFILTKGDYNFFVDSLNQENLFCITQNENDKLDFYAIEPENAPQDMIANVIRLEKVKEDDVCDYFDIKLNHPIEFYVYRIKWISVFSDKSNI